jgi:hypothetical protein
MRRLALATVLLALVAATTAAAAAAPALPLAAGNRWVLRDADGLSTGAVAIRLRPAGLTLSGLPLLPETRVRAEDPAVTAWDAAGRRWEPFLRLGAPVGTTYKVDLSGTGWRGLTVTVASRTLVLEVLGRRRPGCIRLVFSAPKGTADAGVEELVFCPGLGLARVTEQTIAGPRTRRLTSVTLRP